MPANPKDVQQTLALLASISARLITEFENARAGFCEGLLAFLAHAWLQKDIRLCAQRRRRACGGA
jgi:hypothetical protein